MKLRYDFIDKAKISLNDEVMKNLNSLGFEFLRFSESHFNSAYIKLQHKKIGDCQIRISDHKSMPHNINPNTIYCIKSVDGSFLLNKLMLFEIKKQIKRKIAKKNRKEVKKRSYHVFHDRDSYLYLRFYGGFSTAPKSNQLNKFY